MNKLEEGERKVSGKRNNYASLAMLMYMGNWAVISMNARTSTNAVETILLPIGVYYWTQIEDRAKKNEDELREIKSDSKLREISLGKLKLKNLIFLTISNIHKILIQI